MERHWTRARRSWVAEQRFEHPAQQIVFEELIQVGEKVIASIPIGSSSR